ncbi:MAG: peptidase T [Deltaproteobacteria bacterium]|nr:peptidase T [Deltaproteobacteria bacterium]
MSTMLDRFLRYVRIDTQASEQSKTIPSTPGQLELGRQLVEELKELGLSDVVQEPSGLVVATLPGSSPGAPTIAWLAHLDTSPETSGANVRPIVHTAWDGADVVLPGDSTQILRVQQFPELESYKGKTLITSDGTTLLGGDDKAGVAIIVEAARLLLASPELAHGPIKLVFTCDEEVGRGAIPVDLDRLGAVVGYTVDGAAEGEIEAETFSADKATVTFVGINIHPCCAKGKMVNALRLAGLFLSRLPRTSLSPETTEGREGFIHPTSMDGSVGKAELRLLLRDFDTSKLAVQAELLRSIASAIEAEYPAARVDVQVQKQYRNMAEGIAREPRAMSFAIDAMRRAGIEPRILSIRGGTDGSRLTERGLPTPNLPCGDHNPHSCLEWVCLEEMQSTARVLVELAQVWARGNSGESSL